VPFLRRGGRLAPAVLAVATAGSGAVLWVQQGLASPCERESNYFCIRVVDFSREVPFGEARGLVLDHLLHGVTHASAPDLLVPGYTHAIDELTHARFGERYAAGLDWFFAGGGAYTLPRAVRALSPDSRVTVAELDPAVTETAAERLYLDTAGMEIVHQDARLALKARPGPYDVIVGDVFHDVAIPHHLVTREFAALVRERLRPDGLYAMNVVDVMPDPRLVKAIIKTLRSEFEHVDVWMEGPPEHPRVTFILTAHDGEPLPEYVNARNGFERGWHRVTGLLLSMATPLEEIPLLTDDYAPVERLIASLLVGPDD
jgi:predicted O-methyltransferase YrrM